MHLQNALQRNADIYSSLRCDLKVETQGVSGQFEYKLDPKNSYIHVYYPYSMALLCVDVLTCFKTSNDSIPLEVLLSTHIVQQLLCGLLNVCIFVLAGLQLLVSSYLSSCQFNKEAKSLQTHWWAGSISAALVLEIQ